MEGAGERCYLITDRAYLGLRIAWWQFVRQGGVWEAWKHLVNRGGSQGTWWYHVGSLGLRNVWYVERG